MGQHPPLHSVSSWNVNSFVLIFYAAKPNGQGYIQAAKIPSVWDKIGPRTVEIFQTEAEKHSQKCIYVLTEYMQDTRKVSGIIIYVFLFTLVGGTLYIYLTALREVNI